MRFYPAEPDIATIFNRIEDDDIDLQPDFQRGEVWPITKQQRLIDTILRGWVIPPILVVSNGQGKPQQVLDGQQRLAAIRDFKLGKFSVDGRILPNDPLISSLHGKKFSSLPAEIIKRFDRTTLRIYEVTDFRPEEPAEIFFRLNQPTALTSAEKRNAFFGPTRDQIRDLVGRFQNEISEDLETPTDRDTERNTSDIVGFSNSRMAYDDVFARFACTLEQGTLRRKVTAAGVNELYRRESGLSDSIYKKVSSAVKQCHSVIVTASLERPDQSFKLNKATLYSWLIFFARMDSQVDVGYLANFFIAFEWNRSLSSHERRDKFLKNESSITERPLLVKHLADIFTDRAGSRVADVSSVLLRDFSLWGFWRIYGGFFRSYPTEPAFQKIDSYFDSHEMHDEQSAMEFIEDTEWGARI